MVSPALQILSPELSATSSTPVTRGAVAPVSGSSSSIVTVALVAVKYAPAPEAFERVSVKVSGPSLAASSSTVTGTVFVVSPASKVSVPDVSV